MKDNIETTKKNAESQKNVITIPFSTAPNFPLILNKINSDKGVPMMPENIIE